VYSKNALRNELYSMIAKLPRDNIKGIYNIFRSARMTGRPIDFIGILALVVNFLSKNSTIDQVIAAIENERLRQIELWPNDAKLNYDAWVVIIDQQVAKYGACLVDETAYDNYTGESSWSRAVKLAAVAVGAGEGLFAQAKIQFPILNDLNEALGTSTRGPEECPPENLPA